MDLHSKKSFGYAYDLSMTAELAIKAVKNACLNVKDTVENCLKERGIIHSFSRKGTPYDDACIESFHSILKKEEVTQKEYEDFKSVKRSLFEYIETWYNRKRIHSTINYLTPQAAHSAS